MKHTNAVHLLMPQLLQPLPGWAQDFGFMPEASVFTLLKKASQQAIPADNWQSLLLQFLTPQLPQGTTAQWRYQLHGCHKLAAVESDTASNRIILCADPVVLEPGVDALVLVDDQPVLSMQESEALLHDLNVFLAQDGAYLVAGTSHCWYLILPEPSSLISYFPAQALGQNVHSFLPQSESNYWQRLMSEIQMLLFTHPVNQQREQCGLPSINSLWLWGEQGVAQASVNGVANDELVDDAYEWIVGGGEYAKALALAAGLQWFDHHELSDYWLQHRCLIIDEGLIKPALQADATAWEQHLEQWRQRYFEPAYQASQAGKMALSLSSGDGMLYYFKARKPLWRFW